MAGTSWDRLKSVEFHDGVNGASSGGPSTPVTASAITPLPGNCLLAAIRHIDGTIWSWNQGLSCQLIAGHTVHSMTNYRTELVNKSPMLIKYVWIAALTNGDNDL